MFAPRLGALHLGPLSTLQTRIPRKPLALPSGTLGYRDAIPDISPYSSISYNLSLASLDSKFLGEEIWLAQHEEVFGRGGAVFLMVY